MRSGTGGRIIVIAPTRAACETIELAFTLDIETVLWKSHGERLRALAARLTAEGERAGHRPGFGIVAGTGTGKTLSIKPIAQIMLATDDLRVGVINREREATPETPTWNVIIVTTGIARRCFQDGDIRPQDTLARPTRVCYSLPMPTPERIQKVERVLAHRQADLRVVLEGITNAHNCQRGHAYLRRGRRPAPGPHRPQPRAPPYQRGHIDPGRQVARDGVHATSAAGLGPLKKAGFEIVATHLVPEAVPYTDVDFARPVALVFGSESEGITDDCLAYADRVVRIPMLGMVQSVNLSVSVAVMLYEALRQRAAKGYGEASRLPEAEFERLRRQWLNITE